MSKKKYLGIVYIILSAFWFTLMNAFVRLAGDLPSVEKAFFRNFIAFFFAFVVLKKNHIPIAPSKNKNLPFLILRATAGTIGLLCNFYAVDHLVLSDASMLNKMSPFFAVIFSAIFLKEKTTPVQFGAVIIAFIGALFIIKPSFENISFLPALIGFIGGISAGGAYTAVRYLSNNGEKAPYIIFFFSSFSCLILLPFLIFCYEPMTLKQLLFLLLGGLSACGGQFSITSAYSYAPAKEISVFDYSQIIFSAVLGFILFGQIPDCLSFLGYFIIVLMAVGMFIYNNKRTKDEE